LKLPTEAKGMRSLYYSIKRRIKMVNIATDDITKYIKGLVSKEFGTSKKASNDSVGVGKSNNIEKERQYNRKASINKRKDTTND
jgi:hypothetical protein